MRRRSHRPEKKHSYPGKNPMGFMVRIYQPRTKIRSSEGSPHEDPPPPRERAAPKSEQAKDRFDGNPRGHRMLRSVSRRRKSPAAHGLGGALIQAKTDTLDDADSLRPSIRTHENL